ncbi:MAG: diacylglycerol kinase [Cyclobacteriaceae bacterium]
MQESGKFSIKKRVKSFSFAINGLKYLIRNEHNARIHLLATICVIVLGVLLGLKPAEWISIVLVIGLVLISELFNSAIEKLADMIDPTWNTKIGLIKDYCAAAVLLSSIISVIVGGFIFIPKLVVLVKNIY